MNLVNKTVQSILVSLSIIILFSNCVTKKLQSECDENLIFKNVFFSKISIVDRKMEGKPVEGFDEALKFLSNYAYVDFASMGNYNFSYPYGAYIEDKRGWLKWYEENKCNNIQFRK